MKKHLKNNYHTHCKYCHHAQGEVEDYVKKAIDLKFEEIGITDHAPVIPNLVQDYGEEYSKFASNMEHDKIDIYLNDIKKCKIKYENKIKVYSGFETEFLIKGINFYKYLKNKVDYLIIGMHYFDSDKKIISTYDDELMNFKSVDDYATACVNASNTGLFKILAHPDLFMLKYKNKDNENKFDEYAKNASIKIIEAAIKNNIYLEINCNGPFDHNIDFKDWSYPNLEFWKLVKLYPEAKIIIGADAHNISALDSTNIDRIYDFIKELDLHILDKAYIK